MKTPSVLRTPLGQISAALIAVVLIVVVFAVLGYRSTRQSVSDLAETQRIALSISARSDCRAEISARFGEIRETRDVIGEQVGDARAESQHLINEAFARSFQGITPVATQADYEHFLAVDAEITRLTAEHATASLAVDRLPRLDLAVDHGYPPLKIAPCPKVG